MSMKTVPPLSVMPPLLKQTKIGVPVRTVRVLAVAGLLIVATLAANIFTGKKLDSSQRDLANAQAQTTQIANERRTLEQSTGGGDAGATKIELVKGLIKSRMDWVKIVQEFNTTLPDDIRLGPVELALGSTDSSASPNGAAPPPTGAEGTAPSGAAPTGAPQKLQVYVGAPSLTRVRQYIADLEKNNSYVESAVFKSAREGGPGLVATVELTIKGPPARPAATGAATPNPDGSTTPPTTPTP